MKTIIHVNQHNIKHNAKHPDDQQPVLTVKTYKGNTKTNSITVDGPCQIVYSPDKPLSCGAKVWITTEAHVYCEPFEESPTCEL